MARSSNNRNAARAVTTGSTVRFEQPRSSRQPKPRTTPEIHPIGGFTNFLREYTIVTLAVGFVIATQVQGLVRQLVADFIDPLSKLLFTTALSQRTFTLHFHGRAANFAWGDLAYGVIDFLFVLFVIFIIIRFLHLDKLNKPKKKASKEQLEVD